MVPMLAQRDLDWTNLFYVLFILVLPALNSLGQWIRSKYDKKDEELLPPAGADAAGQRRAPKAPPPAPKARPAQGRPIARAKGQPVAGAKRKPAKPVAKTGPWDMLGPILGDLGPLIEELQPAPAKPEKRAGKPPWAKRRDQSAASPGHETSGKPKKRARKSKKKIEPQVTARPAAPPPPPTPPEAHGLPEMMRESDAKRTAVVKSVLRLPLTLDDMRSAVILSEVLAQPVGLRRSHLSGPDH